MTHTDDHTRLQLRTIVPGTTDQFLRIESGPFVTNLELIEQHRNDKEIRTRIYLSPEQWEQLSKVAAEMAKHPNTSKHDDDHWDNEKVLAWQDKNREQKLAMNIAGLQKYLADYGSPIDYKLAEFTFSSEAVAALIEAGEIREGRGSGRQRTLEIVK